MRNGHPVAKVGHAAAADGAAVKAVLMANPRDPKWAKELRELLAGLGVEERPWSD